MIRTTTSLTTASISRIPQSQAAKQHAWKDEIVDLEARSPLRRGETNDPEFRRVRRAVCSIAPATTSTVITPSMVAKGVCGRRSGFHTGQEGEGSRDESYVLRKQPHRKYNGMRYENVNHGIQHGTIRL